MRGGMQFCSPSALKLNKLQNGISPLIWILTPRSALKVHKPYISHESADSYFTRAFIVIQDLVSQNAMVLLHVGTVL